MILRIPDSDSKCVLLFVSYHNNYHEGFIPTAYYWTMSSYKKQITFPQNFQLWLVLTGKQYKAFWAEFWTNWLNFLFEALHCKTNSKYKCLQNVIIWYDSSRICFSWNSISSELFHNPISVMCWFLPTSMIAPNWGSIETKLCCL